MSQSWILDHLHPLLSIDEAELERINALGGYLPATQEDILELRETIDEIPEDYLDLVSACDGIKIRGRNSDKPGLYISVLGCIDILGWKQWYPFLDEAMPNCFFFAQDGDDCLLLGTHSERTGVYMMGISSADWQYAKYVAPSIKAMLCDGIGWANGELE